MTYAEDAMAEPKNMYKKLTTVMSTGLCAHLIPHHTPTEYREGDKLSLAECGVCRKYFGYDPEKGKFIEITRAGYLQLQKL